MLFTFCSQLLCQTTSLRLEFWKNKVKLSYHKATDDCRLSLWPALSILSSPPLCFSIVQLSQAFLKLGCLWLYWRWTETNQPSWFQPVSQPSGFHKLSLCWWLAIKYLLYCKSSAGKEEGADVQPKIQMTPVHDGYIQLKSEHGDFNVVANISWFTCMRTHALWVSKWVKASLSTKPHVYTSDVSV